MREYYFDHVDLNNDTMISVDEFIESYKLDESSANEDWEVNVNFNLNIFYFKSL